MSHKPYTMRTFRNGKVGSKCLVQSLDVYFYTLNHIQSKSCDLGTCKHITVCSVYVNGITSDFELKEIKREISVHKNLFYNQHFDRDANYFNKSISFLYS